MSHLKRPGTTLRHVHIHLQLSISWTVAQAESVCSCYHEHVNRRELVCLFRQREKCRAVLRFSATFAILNPALLTFEITHKHSYTCTDTPLYFSLYLLLKACHSGTKGVAASMSSGWTLAVTDTDRCP